MLKPARTVPESSHVTQRRASASSAIAGPPSPARACTDDLIIRIATRVTNLGTFSPCSRPCRPTSKPLRHVTDPSHPYRNWDMTSLLTLSTISSASWWRSAKEESSTCGRQGGRHVSSARGLTCRKPSGRPLPPHHGSDRRVSLPVHQGRGRSHAPSPQSHARHLP